MLEALGDGRLHYLQGDLDGLTGIPIYDLYVPLARLEQSGRVRSGWDDSTPWRRWYQVASSAR